MKTSQVITCNNCSEDITFTDYAEDYRIVVTSERMALSGPICMDLAIVAPIQEPRHFCDFDCLRSWGESVTK